jgi:hypothetical protein
MDPLRPFAHLIRSLWTGKRPAAGTAGAATQSTGAQHPHAVAASSPVANRLQTRLAALQQWNGERARELFVEHILLMELGEDLALDPAFADLVQRVCSQLATEPAVGARLDELLQQVAAGRNVT